MLINSFYHHGAYLYRHLEIYTSPNNHLVGEATALYLLGCFFPEFDESPAWRERGWNVLLTEPERQFYEDGGSTEQATFYHHYCLGFFSRRHDPHFAGYSVPESMRERLESACEFGMWMTTPDGTVPRIGDADDSRSIRIGAAPLWDFRNLLNIGAILFGRADVKAVSGPFSEDALWLLGAKGYEAYDACPPNIPQQRHVFFPTVATPFCAAAGDWRTITSASTAGRSGRVCMLQIFLVSLTDTQTCCL